LVSASCTRSSPSLAFPHSNVAYLVNVAPRVRTSSVSAPSQCATPPPRVGRPGFHSCQRSARRNGWVRFWISVSTSARALLPAGTCPAMGIRYTLPAPCDVHALPAGEAHAVHDGIRHPDFVDTLAPSPDTL